MVKHDHRVKGIVLSAVLLSTLLAAAMTAPAPGKGGPAQRPAFEGSATPLDRATRERMTGSSWHRGCPVGLGDLRLLRLSYWGFDGRAHAGRLVVHEGWAKPMLRVMRKLYRQRYPIRRMRLVDAYGADDHRSMDADNTSAFNCRFIAGQPGVWSQHAYGKAIDLNPVENPYVTASGHSSPPAGAPYADRTRRAPGMVHAGDPVVRAFDSIGWSWGRELELPEGLSALLRQRPLSRRPPDPPVRPKRAPARGRGLSLRRPPALRPRRPGFAPPPWPHTGPRRRS